MFKPSDWDTEQWGEWNPLLDGMLVQVNGEYSRCFQPRVAYSRWEDLRRANLSNYREPPAIDPWNRTRVPYGFGTDRWADLGNLSVYRHDMGADPYELFHFFITEQELRHIFDNYRRGRQGFSVRGASSRILHRYNEKMRDAAKGMGLIKNDTLNPALMDLGDSIPASLFPSMVGYWNVSPLMLASGMAFDHFSRQLQRPNAGPHVDPRIGLPPGIPPAAVPAAELVPLRFDDFGTPAVVVPDGAQGFWDTVGIGGKPVNNALASDKGEFDSEYTINAGSYYDKIYTAMLLTESVDNFISDSIEDFTDPRYRSVSMADLLPDGYRRWLANNLTGDDWIKGPRVATTPAGNVQVDSEKYPSQPIGWTSWWPDTPEICFANTGTAVCTGWDIDGVPFKANTPANTRPIDPQVSWEQHKFLIADTLIYLPENQKTLWLDMMGVWAIGDDTDPGFVNRIELHPPHGDTYVARTYGTEEICFEECRTVQRGIAARMLEYANELLALAYEVTPVTLNGTTWYEPVLDANGQPQVKYDPTLVWLDGFYFTDPPADCNDTDDSGCKCEHNAACMKLGSYLSVPDFMRQAMRDFGMADPSMKGIY